MSIEGSDSVTSLIPAPSKPASHWVLIGVGGNLGDPDYLFKHAARLLAPYVVGFQSSAHYLSEAYYDMPGVFADKAGVPEFTNAVWSAYTELNPFDVLGKLLSIEAQLGRIRGSSQSISRSLDLDLLLYDDRVIDSPELKLPHPRMHLRNFVLRPACELAPHFIHPVLGKQLSELLRVCPDGLCVVKSR